MTAIYSGRCGRGSVRVGVLAPTIAKSSKARPKGTLGIGEPGAQIEADVLGQPPPIVEDLL
jgi:hypothetical protein